MKNLICLKTAYWKYPDLRSSDTELFKYSNDKLSGQAFIAWTPILHNSTDKIYQVGRNLLMEKTFTTKLPNGWFITALNLLLLGS